VFERYTEEARRVIFFARYEASVLASSSIEAEHLLLGLLREARGVAGKVFHLRQLTYEAIRKEIELRVAPGEPMSTAVDIPLSAPARSVLQHAAEEANRLHAEHIGTEHLLLGLLREPGSLPASVLASNLRLEDVREEVRLLARAGGVAHRVEAFENLATFLAAVEARGGRHHVVSFREAGVRVEVSGPEQRWAVTFFVNGGVTVETFAPVGGVQDETGLPGLLDALGPPRPKD
jgi:ATP-dependent Clp protease ATP-binding subunit ClpA